MPSADALNEYPRLPPAALPTTAAQTQVVSSLIGGGGGSASPDQLEEEDEFEQEPQDDQGDSVRRRRQQRREGFHKAYVYDPPPISSASEPNLSSKRNAAAKKKRKILANIFATRYDCVRESLENAGFSCTTSEDQTGCFIVWSDLAVPNERILELKAYQRINHFPGMAEICRKDLLAKNMSRMHSKLPAEYDFTPKTWIMPQDSTRFIYQTKDYIRKGRKKGPKTYIAKPSNGAMGNGIWLFKNPDKAPLDDNYIIQEYLDKPMLIDGFKFDMRVYVLVLSCDPLKVFLYRDGLVRLSTKQYVQPSEHNMDQLFMHLTNYSVNKFNEDFDKTEDEFRGSKRSFEFLLAWLDENGYDSKAVWNSISDIVVKTLLLAEPHIIQQYRMCRPGTSPLADSSCFEVLGFDIFLDRNGKPWLLEINRAPSFGTNERIDQNVKAPLLEQTFKLLRIRPSDKKKSLALQKTESQNRLFRNYRRGMPYGPDKNRALNYRRREQLKIQLEALRKESSRQDYEAKNCGNFKRVFPSDDRALHERYTEILSAAFECVLSGRASNLQREVIKQLKNPQKEEDIIDMIEQFETDGSVEMTAGQPKPLSSMPSSSPRRSRKESQSSDDSYDDVASQRSRGQSSSKSGSSPLRQSSQRKRLSTQSSERPSLFSRSSNRSVSSFKNDPTRGIPVARRKREPDDMLQLCDHLSELNIKFPGKSDEEAGELINSILDNWRYHKPRVASYWLVKLDSAKRQKVIDIVKNNVRSVIQKIYENQDIDTLRVTKFLNKVLARMVWSHGQGLWACLNHWSGTAPPPWETVFKTGGETLSSAEYACCRIAVELCKDCLLVVYQFANQTRGEAAAAQAGASGGGGS